MFDTLSIDHLWLFFFWVIYFFVHSLFASIKLKSYVEQLFPNRFKYYRLIYNIVSLVLLMPILWFSTHMHKQYLVPQSEFLMFFGLLMAVAGAILGKISFGHYDAKEFLGLRQIKLESTEKPKLQTKGVLKYTRHPLYLATILIVVGFWIMSPTTSNLVTVVAIILYLYIGIRLEERRLIAEFGEEYVEYKKKTPILLPKWRKR
jgi:methanethiol S-methyltransferase